MPTGGCPSRPGNKPRPAPLREILIVCFMRCSIRSPTSFRRFNLFRYISFRSFGAVATALLVSLILGPRVIAWLNRGRASGQPIREGRPAEPPRPQEGDADDGRVPDPAGADRFQIFYGPI